MTDEAFGLAPQRVPAGKAQSHISKGERTTGATNHIQDLSFQNCLLEGEKSISFFSHRNRRKVGGVQIE